MGSQMDRTSNPIWEASLQPTLLRPRRGMGTPARLGTGHALHRGHGLGRSGGGGALAARPGGRAVDLPDDLRKLVSVDASSSRVA